MPYQGRPDRAVTSMITAMGGRVWIEGTAVTAGGTGTSRASIETHRVPDAARMLVGIIPTTVPTTEAVALTCQNMIDLAGVNYKFQPQQVLSIGGGAGLSVGAPMLQQQEFWDVFVPVSGGETWDVGVTPLVADSENSRNSVDFVWTDMRIAMPLLYSLVGTTTAIGTGAGNFAGTDMSINNSHSLVETFGAVANNAAVAAGKNLNVQVTEKCTVWQPIQQINWYLQPAASPIATSGYTQNWVTRKYLAIDFTADRATISTVFNLDQSVTTAGNAVQAIRWI